MTLNKFRYFLSFALLIPYGVAAQKNVFPIITKDSKVSIVYDNKAPKVDSISANLLAEDIERVTSFKPSVLTDLAKAKGHVIVIGAANSPLVQKIAGKGSFLPKK